MNWDKMRHFNKQDFADNPDDADPGLLYAVEEGRVLVGERMYPSTVEGSLCRVGGSETSQHYIGPHRSKILRKSTATDMFVEGTPIKNLHTFLGSGLFKGIGLYLDTTGINGRPWVMTHLDTRAIEQPLIWIAYKKEDKTKYAYPWQPLFYNLIQDKRLYQKYSYR